jgi:hypothetical protein
MQWKQLRIPLTYYLKRVYPIFTLNVFKLPTTLIP